MDVGKDKRRVTRREFLGELAGAALAGSVVAAAAEAEAQPEVPEPPANLRLGASRPIAAVSLRNLAGAPTPARTLLPFGHPFAQGDLTPGRRLRVTWTPAQGQEVDVPWQLSAVATRPDSSVRFAAVQCAIPSVPAGGSGTLQLYSAPGTQDTAIPGGKSVTQVRDALLAAHDFRVHVANLRRGREKITVGAGGAGYAATDTIRLSGGAGSAAQPPQSALSVGAGGAITAVKFKAPDPPYTSPPTVTVSSSSGSGAQLTYLIPALDGSGSWVWKAGDQLALLGSRDGSGRVRCEAVEAGPLAVTFHCWGPLIDSAGGASHPHLVVRAWYRCWLAADGTIDRVEYLHALEQGWLGDLDGGSVDADFQAGDVTVRRNGSPVSGRAWSNVRVPHHTTFALTTVDSSSFSWTTGGSDWTTGAPTLLATFDTAYWVRSRIVPPYDLAFFAANPISPADDATPSTYRPGAGPAGNFARGGAMFINQTGDTDNIGMLTQWSIRALLSQKPGYIQSDTASALWGGSMPCWFRNPATGRIPVVVPSSIIDAQTLGLGANLPTTYFHSGIAKSADLKLAAGDGGYAPTDVTNTSGGWQGPYEGSHWPTPCYHAYLRTGAPWLRELVILFAHQPFFDRNPGTNRRTTLPDGTVYLANFTRPTMGQEERAEAWTWKALAHALAVLPDAAPERAYFQKLYDANAANAVRFLAAASVNFRALGIWGFSKSGPVGDPTRRGYVTSPYLSDYLFQARAWAYLAFGDADTRTWLEHYAASIRGRCGGDPGQTCPWGISPYRTCFGYGSDYSSGWGATPHYTLHDASVSFDAATGWITGQSRDLFNQPLAVGTWFFFVGWTDPDAPGTAPPTGGTLQDGTQVAIDPRRPYYVAVTDTVGNRVRVSPNANGSNPFVAFSSSPAGVGYGIRLNRCPSLAADGPDGTLMSGANAYSTSVILAGVMELAIATGVVAPDEPWIDAYRARVASARAAYNWARGGVDWPHKPKFKFGPTTDY